jgi:hypothetical protein
MLLCLAGLSALAAPAMADPIATTEAVSDVTTASAVLNGQANPTTPDAACSFQYGETTAYDHVVDTEAMTSSQVVAYTLTGLLPNTTYHVQFVCSQGTSTPPQGFAGGDVTFTTLPIAGTVAVTGSATSITSTSAVLNGIANPTSDNSSWTFQYGTNQGYGSDTAVQTVSRGVHAVSIRLGNLRPGTTYHYRIVVSPPGPPGTSELGADATFTTKPAAPVYGRASLATTKLKVRHGAVTLAFRCRGKATARCAGKAVLTTRSKARTVRCGTGRFSGPVGPETARIRLSHQCAALLKAAKRHTLHGTLVVTYSTHQPTHRPGVTLTG